MAKTGFVRIGKRVVGEDKPCFIIAEAGANHNGSLSQAKKLVDVAAEAGADAVKFQIYSAEKLYSRYTPDFGYLKGKKTYDLIKEIETPRAWIKDLSAYCEKKGVVFLASPFDHEAVDLLERYVPAYKMASFEIVDLGLLSYAAGKGKPMIISTGMANNEEIREAIIAVESAGNEKIILLHCNSLYPAPYEIVNLRAMDSMRKEFNLPVGFSDHTLGISIPLAAAALGACVIEKHYTLDRKLPGPDHSFALEPDELNQMIKGIREIERALGSGVKDKSSLESAEMYSKARRSLHAARDIRKGESFSREMVTTKRPGYGIKPKHLHELVGKKARRDIKEDEWITWEMVA